MVAESLVARLLHAFRHMFGEEKSSPSTKEFHDLAFDVLELHKVSIELELKPRRFLCHLCEEPSKLLNSLLKCITIPLIRIQHSHDPLLVLPADTLNAVTDI